MPNYKCPKDDKAITFGNVNLKRERATQILCEVRKSRRTDMLNTKRNVVIETPQKGIVTKNVIKKNITDEKAEKLKKWREEKLKRKKELKERPPFNRFAQVHHTGSSPYKTIYNSRPLVSFKSKDSSLTFSDKPAVNKGEIFPLKGPLPTRQTKQVISNPPVSRLTTTVKPNIDNKMTIKTVEVKPAVMRTVTPRIASFKGNVRSTRITSRNSELNKQRVNLVSDAMKKSVILKPVRKNKPGSNENKVNNDRAANSKAIKSVAGKSKKEATKKRTNFDKENLCKPLTNEQETNLTFEIESKEQSPLKTPSRTKKSKRVPLTPLQTAEKSEDPPNGISFQRERLEKETVKLLERAKIWEEISQSRTLPEKIKDEIDLVVGQTRLLTSNKFLQFKGLIEKCERKAQNITFDDLDGFWEMMYIQVEQLEEKYNELARVEESGWRTPAVAVKSRKRNKGKRTAMKKRSTKVSSPAPPVRRSLRRSIFDLNPNELAQIVVNSPKGLTPASHFNLINARRTSRSSFGHASLQASIKSKEVLSP